MNDRTSGNPKFEATLLPHLGAAYNFARWLLHDEADAQDVVQESFMRALRYFDSLHAQDPLPWLLTIVRHTAFTWLKKSRRHQAEPLDDDAPLPDPTQPDPAEAASLHVDIDALRQCLDELPPEFREVIVLRELEGLSYKQIASVTGASLGTVMSRLSRARQRLQQSALTRHSKEIDHGM